MTNTNNDALVINFDDFDGHHQWEFLSNFYHGEPIPLWGRDWQTGEHAFQAMKSLDDAVRDHIWRAGTPGIAKMRGRKCVLRNDWEAVKYDVMAAVLRAKFTLDRDEGRWLVQRTRDALLVEGTTWNDAVWGVAGRSTTANGKGGVEVTSVGRNWLGTLLMARRAELLAEAKFRVVHDTLSANASFCE